MLGKLDVINLNSLQLDNSNKVTFNAGIGFDKVCICDDIFDKVIFVNSSTGQILSL